MGKGVLKKWHFLLYNMWTAPNQSTVKSQSLHLNWSTLNWYVENTDWRTHQNFFVIISRGFEPVYSRNTVEDPPLNTAHSGQLPCTCCKRLILVFTANVNQSDHLSQRTVHHSASQWKCSVRSVQKIQTAAVYEYNLSSQQLNAELTSLELSVLNIHVAPSRKCTER